MSNGRESRAQRGEPSGWTGRVRPSKMFIVVLVVTVGALAGTLWLIAEIDMVTLWLTAGLVVLVILTAVLTSWFRVRIDASGLEVRSLVGWPVFRVPVDDVERASAEHISPFAEFGGWGLRWSPKRFGIVVRTGEGIVVTRKSGKIFAVTVDDASAGAKALTAAVRESRKGRGRGGRPGGRRGSVR